MKKILLLICILCLALLLCACGDTQENPPADDGKNSDAEKHYTVTFMLDDENSEECKVKEGDTIGEMPMPTRDGYRFMAWCDRHGMPFYPDTVVNEDITLYATWEAENELKITQQPTDVSCEMGDWITFTVKAECNGSSIRYQWQYYDTAAKKFVNFDSNDGGWSAHWNTATLTVWADVYDSLQVRCIVESGNYSLTSRVATMTAKNANAPVITQQPWSTTATLEGPNDTDDIEFTVSVSGGTAPYKYQWEVMIMGGSDAVSDGEYWDVFEDPCFVISGSNTDTLKLKDVRSFGDGFEFRCRITDSAGNVIYSDFARVIVNSLGA